MRMRVLRPTVGHVHSKEAPNMKKSLTITAAAVVLIALAAAASLFTLSAVAGSHQTCGKVDTAELRAAGRSRLREQARRLARCGH